MNLTTCEWKWIFRDRNHCLVFAQEQPIPYSLAMRYVLIAVKSVCVMVTVMCLLATHIVECVVA